jgi:hypothetical protein
MHQNHFKSSHTREIRLFFRKVILKVVLVEDDNKLFYYIILSYGFRNLRSQIILSYGFRNLRSQIYK